MTPMGFAANADTDEEANEVFYTEIDLEDSVHMVGRLVEFSWRDLMPSR